MFTNILYQEHSIGRVLTWQTPRRYTNVEAGSPPSLHHLQDPRITVSDIFFPDKTRNLRGAVLNVSNHNVLFLYSFPAFYLFWLLTSAVSSMYGFSASSLRNQTWLLKSSLQLFSVLGKALKTYFHHIPLQP